MSLRVDKKTNAIIGTLWVRSADVTSVMSGKNTKLSMFTCVTGNLNMYKGCDVVIKLPGPRVNMPVDDIRNKVKGGDFTDHDREILNKFIDTLVVSSDE